jgi:hypothetical protein
MDAEVDRFRVLSVCQQFCFGFISIHRHVAETVFEKPRNFFVGDISRSYARCCYVGVYYSTYLLTYDTTYFYDNDTILPLATVAVRAPCRLSVPMPSSQVSTRAPLLLFGECRCVHIPPPAPAAAGALAMI